MNKVEAECVGLWLAEGDMKTVAEITFTNSCEDLIVHFDKGLASFKKNTSNGVRIYSYGKDKTPSPFTLKSCIYKKYIDIRARRPYYIWRLACRPHMLKWHTLVKKYLLMKKYWPDILRGFFAGEGSVYMGPHKSRKLRISQKEPLVWLEKMFDYFGLKYTFYSKNRTYEFTGKTNWDLFEKYSICSLHPEKKIRFNTYYHSYVQTHYHKLYLEKAILEKIFVPCTSRELSLLFRRSQARIFDILSLLHKKGYLERYWVGSTVYWVHKESQIVVISKKNEKYLKALKQPISISDLSKQMQIGWKSAQKHVSKLEKLQLVKKTGTNKWIQVQIQKKLAVK